MIRRWVYWRLNIPNAALCITWDLKLKSCNRLYQFLRKERFNNKENILSFQSILPNKNSKSKSFIKDKNSRFVWFMPVSMIVFKIYFKYPFNKGFAKIAQYLSIYIHYMVLKKGWKKWKSIHKMIFQISKKILMILI